MRAIDFHVHLPTPDWLDGSMAGYVEAAEAYFRSRVERQSLESLAAKYRALDALAVLLAWDAETATGRPRVPNSTVADAVRAHPDAFTGIGSVDPHKESAVDEVAEIAALGLRGVKFHPSLQAFAPDDEKFWPVFAACEANGLLALFHTGTSGIGARQPGGQGIRIDYSHPLKLDAVAAAFPRLTVVAAHFGWPWHMDLLAMALHKTNVYIDISGWSPKRIPPEVIRELKGRLAGQFVWGSDFPFIAPERCLGELAELGLDAPALLRDNAARVLGLPALPRPVSSTCRGDGGDRRRSIVSPVTDPSGFDSRSRLTFHGPLSGARADRLAAELAARGPETVADYGCGWGELLLRVLAAAPGARGRGIDLHGPDIARARNNAGKRGLADRAAFIEGPAADHASKADAVINCGAYQAFGDIPAALKALRGLVNPGGRVLFGAEIWDRTPTGPQLSAMWPGTTPETCLYLPDVVDAAVAAGFRPLRIETATRGEWDEFESRLATGAEEWLLANSDHPAAGQVRDRLDAHLSIWLRGHRDVMGFAYLTLGAPA